MQCKIQIPCKIHLSCWLSSSFTIITLSEILQWPFSALLLFFSRLIPFLFHCVFLHRNRSWGSHFSQLSFFGPSDFSHSQNADFEPGHFLNYVVEITFLCKGAYIPCWNKKLFARVEFWCCGCYRVPVWRSKTPCSMVRDSTSCDTYLALSTRRNIDLPWSCNTVYAVGSCLLSCAMVCHGWHGWWSTAVVCQDLSRCL